MSSKQIEISLSREVSREISSSRSVSTADDRTNSSPPQVPSLSPTTGSQEEEEEEDDYPTSSDPEDWDGVDEIDPLDSVSRSHSRPPNPEKPPRVYVEQRPEPLQNHPRESSRQPLPPAPEPKPRRNSHREAHDSQEPEEHRERRRSRHRHRRRRNPSAHSDSVQSNYYDGGHPRQGWGQPPPPPHHHSNHQWEFVPHHQPHPGYAQSSVSSGGAVYNPFTGNPMPMPNSQLVHYQQPFHPSYYSSPSPGMSPYASPNPMASPPVHPAYYEPHRSPPAMPMVPPYGYYPSYPMHPFSGMPPPANLSGTSSADTEKISKLEELMITQEKARIARDEEREAKLETERRYAQALAAKKAQEKEAADKLADAEKRAKAAAEADFTTKTKAAEEEHQKALEEQKKKTEAAEKAEKDAKTAAEAAKKEAAALKPADNPIKFKDAVGRTFSFPWQLCKTWKGMEGLIKQAFLHVDVIGQHVQEGHYDLMGPNGEIILPQVWENTVEPDWTVTMHMWPMTEEKKEEPPQKRATTPVASHSSGGTNWLGRRKSKKKKSPPVVNVPVAPSNADAVPPPPPAAPTRPSRSASAGPQARPVDGVAIVKEKRAKSREPVPPLLAWSAASMGMRRKAK